MMPYVRLLEKDYVILYISYPIDLARTKAFQSLSIITLPIEVFSVCEGTLEKYLRTLKREGIDRGEKSVPVITSRSVGDLSYQYSDCAFRLLRGMSRIYSV